MVAKMIPKWLKNEKQRAAVGFVVAGLAAVVAAGWAVFTYFNKSGAKTEVTYQLCVAPEPTGCPPQTVFVRGAGPDIISTWVNHECAKYKRRDSLWRDGPTKCNCIVVQVTCSG